MTQHQHHHHHHHPHRHHIHRHEEDSSDEESDYTPSASATSSRSTRRRTRTVPTNHESNSVVTPTSTNYYRCLWRHPTPCTLLFTSWDALFQHLADDHVGWAKNKNLCLQCYWSDCQEPEKKKRDHLISHVRSHLPGFRPFLCPICGEGRHRDHEVSKHMVKIHNITFKDWLANATEEEKASNNPMITTLRKKRSNLESGVGEFELSSVRKTSSNSSRGIAKKPTTRQRSRSTEIIFRDFTPEQMSSSSPSVVSSVPSPMTPIASMTRTPMSSGRLGGFVSSANDDMLSDSSNSPLSPFSIESSLSPVELSSFTSNLMANTPITLPQVAPPTNPIFQPMVFNPLQSGAMSRWPPSTQLALPPRTTNHLRSMSACDARLLAMEAPRPPMPMNGGTSSYDSWESLQASFHGMKRGRETPTMELNNPLDSRRKRQASGDYPLSGIKLLSPAAPSPTIATGSPLAMPLAQPTHVQPQTPTHQMGFSPRRSSTQVFRHTNTQPLLDTNTEFVRGRSVTWGGAPLSIPSPTLASPSEFSMHSVSPSGELRQTNPLLTSSWNIPQNMFGNNSNTLVMPQQRPQQQQQQQVRMQMLEQQPSLPNSSWVDRSNVNNNNNNTIIRPHSTDGIRRSSLVGNHDPLLHTSLVAQPHVLPPVTSAETMMNTLTMVSPIMASPMESFSPMQHQQMNAHTPSTLSPGSTASIMDMEVEFEKEILKKSALLANMLAAQQQQQQQHQQMHGHERRQSASLMMPEIASPPLPLQPTPIRALTQPTMASPAMAMQSPLQTTTPPPDANKVGPVLMNEAFTKPAEVNRKSYDDVCDQFLDFSNTSDVSMVGNNPTPASSRPSSPLMTSMNEMRSNSMDSSASSSITQFLLNDSYDDNSIPNNGDQQLADSTNMGLGSHDQVSALQQQHEPFPIGVQKVANELSRLQILEKELYDGVCNY